jgi:hypothetical protein
MLRRWFGLERKEHVEDYVIWIIIICAPQPILYKESNEKSKMDRIEKRHTETESIPVADGKLGREEATLET